VTRIIAYSSPFVPVEWIAAHGLRPWRVVPECVADGATAAGGICPFAHDFVKTVAGRALGAADAVAGVVFTATCDQMRRAAELAERAAPRLPVFLMHVPATWQNEGAVALYIQELRRMGDFLVRVGGLRPPVEKLVETVMAFDAERQRTVAPDAPAERAGKRIAVVGGPLRAQDQWIFAHLRRAGATVALDATEYGQRSRPGPVDVEKLRTDPLRELARAYFLSIPDAFRRPDAMLHDYLRREIAARNVRGVLLVRCVWCDQWHAQVGRLKETLGVPLVDIDFGPSGADRSRIGSRIDALLEGL
jgi:benzoyl-CoA reductase/2-hydroxyglutaryl-CoA dehydratase subunit BcrC/BadD/HgdB